MEYWPVGWKQGVVRTRLPNSIQSNLFVAKIKQVLFTTKHCTNGVLQNLLNRWWCAGYCFNDMYTFARAHNCWYGGGCAYARDGTVQSARRESMKQHGQHRCGGCCAAGPVGEVCRIVPCRIWSVSLCVSILVQTNSIVMKWCALLVRN